MHILSGAKSLARQTRVNRRSMIVKLIDQCIYLVKKNAQNLSQLAQKLHTTVYTTLVHACINPNTITLSNLLGQKCLKDRMKN